MKNTFEIENAFCKHETEKAILVEAEDLDGEVWIPKSQIDDDSEVYGMDEKKNSGTLIISEWFATKLSLV